MLRSVSSYTAQTTSPFTILRLDDHTPQDQINLSLTPSPWGDDAQVGELVHCVDHKALDEALRDKFWKKTICADTL
jgi:predicted transglutaminase-like protease